MDPDNGDASSTPLHVSLPDPTGHRASATPGVAESTAAGPEIAQESVFYLGDGPRGPALFHMPVLVYPQVGRYASAVNGLMEKPEVPWYGTRWAPGWITGASRAGAVVEVAVDGAPAQRPAAMDERTAEQSVQQVVYTMQAASRSHDPVQFTRNGKPATSVLGVPAAEPIGASPPAQVLAPVELQEPEVGGTVMDRASQLASGLCSTPGGDVDVHLLHGDAVVRSVVAHVAGAPGPDHEYPWQVNLDIHGLANGSYSVVTSRPDPADPSLTATDHRPLVLQ